MLVAITHESCLDHLAGAGHPERPERLASVVRALQNHPELAPQIDWQLARPAPREAILRVHSERVVESLAALDARGGGYIDADTSMTARSLAAAEHASGAGLVAVEQLRASRDLRAALCAVRPPGHHATPDRSMGFCLYNNAAITAAALAAQGERVAIVDFDVHHGNGTQDAFYSTDEVLFISLHQHPWYPGTGAVAETGAGAGAGYTVNIPFPAGTTGGAYRRAFDQVVGPRIAEFEPAWLLISAGFDAHRLDPLAELGLTAGDYAHMVRTLRQLVAPGRVIAFLEGGYHLDALALSATAMAAELLGVDHETEPPSADCEPPVLRVLARQMAERT